MTGKDMADRAPRLQRRVERIDRRARHAERAGNTFLFKNENRRIDSAHPGHFPALHRVCHCWMADDVSKLAIFQFFQNIFSFLNTGAYAMILFVFRFSKIFLLA
jgi:hypothetical protein